MGYDNPKDHTDLVSLWVSKVNETAGTLLAPTDWYIVRNAETSAAIPAGVTERRAEIRAFSNDKVTAIQATTTTEELEAYVTSTSFSQWEPTDVVEDPVEEDEDVIFSGVSSGEMSSLLSEDTLTF